MNKKAGFNAAACSAFEIAPRFGPPARRSRTGRRGIFEHNGNYYREGHPPRRLSSFILVPVRDFFKPALPGGIPEFQGQDMQIYAGGVLLGEEFFASAVWCSRAAFVRRINPFEHCAFFGTGSDVQAIKHYLNENYPSLEIVVAGEAGGALNRP